MAQIKVSELFYSIQGEGKYQGVPSIFLRTFGCNFTCGGFGLRSGQKSIERDLVAEHIEDFTEYSQLPLVSTGCDSYASWDPRFKHLSPILNTSVLVDKMLEMLPYKEWRDEHLVITGGEPLLGWQRSYPDLLKDERMDKLKELTFETNGTQRLTDDFYNYLNTWVAKKKREITFSVSPKLSCSGESRADAIQPDIVCEYEEVGYTYLKFVVATEEDADEALDVIKIYRKEGFEGPVYLMPIGGTEKVYSLNNREVARLAMKHGLRYSDRLQVPLFKNAWNT